MNTRARRIVVVVIGVALAWYAAVVAGWAARPLDDTVPVGNLPGWEQVLRAEGAPPPVPVAPGAVVTREVRCGSLFDGDRLDGPLPELPFPQAFNREPCELIRGDARLVFAIDTIVLVLILLGGVLLLLRLRGRPDEPPLPTPALTGTTR